MIEALNGNIRKLCISILGSQVVCRPASFPYENGPQMNKPEKTVVSTMEAITRKAPGLVSGALGTMPQRVFAKQVN